MAALVAPDDGSGRRFVGEQAGEIYVISAAGERLEAPFLDFREQMVTLLEGFDERGLLGIKIPERFHRYDQYAQDLSLLYGKDPQD